MAKFRKERVESLLIQEISSILQRKINDPRVKGVHIVSVKVSADLSSARVGYSTLDDSKKIEEVQAGLDSAKKFIRSEVKKVVQFRHIPEIFFNFDPSIREGDRIIALLRKVVPDTGPQDAGSELSSTDGARARNRPDGEAFSGPSTPTVPTSKEDPEKPQE